VQGNQRHVSNPFHFPHRLAPEQVRSHLHVQPQLLSRTQYPQRQLPIMRRGQYHFIHERRARQFRQVGRASHDSFSRQLPVVQKTANRSPHLGMLLQIVRDSLTQSARSHDQNISRPAPRPHFPLRFLPDTAPCCSWNQPRSPLGSLRLLLTLM
jgi:hypothetical protein